MRPRNLRPGFVRNEDLAQISFEGRLLFQGLWCLADCKGRLEDRPMRMKADLFPYDAMEVEPLVGKLAEKGLILRYEVDGKRLIWIPTFCKHQLISKKEREKGSEWPPHPNDPERAEVKPGSVPDPPRGRPGAPNDRPRPALTTDNGQRTNLSSNKPTREDSVPADAGEREGQSDGEDLPEFGPEALVELWNAAAPPECPRVQRLSAKRRTRARQRLAEEPDPATWERAIGAMSSRPFLRGGGPRGWRADFDWLVQPDSLVRVLEGAYADDAPEREHRPPEADGYRFFAPEVP